MPVGRRGAPSVGRVRKFRELRGGARVGEVHHQELAEQAARVAKSAGVLPRRRVEEDAHRLEHLRADDHGTRPQLVDLPGGAVDVADARRAVALGIHQHLVDHRVGNQRGLARLHRIGDGGERRVEIRVRHAPALAWTTVVAACASVDRGREVGRAADRHQPVEARLHAIAQRALGARHRHRRQVHAVGQHRESLGLARDADVALHDLVVRRQVRVPDRPVHADPVVRRRLEVQIAEAVALTPPHVGAPAHQSRPPHPRERLVAREVRLLQVVDEEVRVPLVARVGLRLLRLQARERPLAAPAIRQRRRGDVLPVVGVVGLAAGLDQGDAKAGFRGALGDPASGGARTDHDEVVRRCRGLAHDHLRLPPPTAQFSQRLSRTRELVPLM